MRKSLLPIFTSAIVLLIAGTFTWRASGAVAAGAGYTLRASWTGADIAGGPLLRPFGIATAPDASIYVTDFRKRVVHLSANGKFLGEFGRPGNGPGEFSNPVGVAVASDGSIYVSDYDQDRIQKFSRDGQFELEFGLHGNGPSEMDAPTGLALDHQGNLYVADFYNDRVDEFTGAGKFVRTIGTPGRVGAGALHYPTDEVVLGGGELLVADAYNYQLQWFSPQGEQLHDVGYHLLGTWPRPASGSDGFNVPSSVAVGPGALIHVADSGNHRIVMLAPDRSYLAQWRLPDADPHIYSPTNLALSPDGKTLYATDFSGNRIIVLSIRHGAAGAQ